MRWIKKSKAFKAFMAPMSTQNPISVLVLGICSALAVTVQLKPSVVMVLAMTFVLTMSNVIVSILRHAIPKNIRIIVELTIIASLVILADQFLKAYMFDVSKQLSVFVGLIITNCIIMGRAEAFAMANNPWLSFWDGLGNGLGYGMILVIVGAIREFFGTGKLWGAKVVPDWLYQSGYVDLGLMVYAPAAFIVIGLISWLQYEWVIKKKND
ncbi:MAG: NADH:ubiquinone reductase (Na(+)-transporting) subunit D [Candidatus Margulisbacteria bacterium]|jgi:Na+-transporting NADH:ubiquinone oxidoreductase subunit D|nr:NADH:ubiquinone reductase (Na(+)-transporting) subunit D [Candidatus Margulisiibacteriota bacterium]